MARIVFASVAYLGDVAPYVAPANRLAERGHEVTFLVPAGFHDMLGGEQFALATYPLDFSARAMVHAGESRGYPLPHSAEGSINKLDHELVVSAGLHFYVLD